MSIESQARWYAVKLILTYFSIITVLIVIGYIDPFYLTIVMTTLFALMLAGAIYRDAYYDKLWELKRDKSE